MFSQAMPNTPWVEYFVGSPPGIPLSETRQIEGEAIPEQSWIKPNDGPGFGLRVKEEWLTPFWG